MRPACQRFRALSIALCAWSDIFSGAAAKATNRHNPRMPIRPLGGACAALLLAACANTPAPSPQATPGIAVEAAPVVAPTAPAPLEVAEAWISEPMPSEELDSLATWTSENGDTWLIASAKSTHRLVVHDAATGAMLRTVGGKGEAPGRFLRPNGLAVFADRLYVVERDNHRVQVLSLPGFEPVETFGEDVLRSPYRIWLNEAEPGELQAYITDSFMYGTRYDVVP